MGFPSETLNKLFIKLQVVYMGYAIQLTMIIQFSPNMWCVFLVTDECSSAVLSKI